MSEDVFQISKLNISKINDELVNSNFWSDQNKIRDYCNGILSHFKNSRNVMVARLLPGILASRYQKW